MFSLDDRPYSLCDRITRRELMRIGGLNLLGLSLPALLRGPSHAATISPNPTFGRAKNVIYLWLQGGPPQHETFDPKPDAPVEIRGPFKPISTSVPGIQFCELLPRTARLAHKLAVVRSLSTDDNTHDTSGYWVLTGNKYPGATARETKPSDWPYFGSVVKMLKPSERVPALSSVWIPDIMRLNDNVRPAGQTGGFLGAQWDPDRFIGDPSDDNYRIEGLSLPEGISPLRLESRLSLFEQVGRHLDRAEQTAALQNYDEIRHAAFGLLASGGARDAFRVRDEPEQVRERYGKNRFGQCVLLARRLVEAGVRLVHVNWPREPGDTAVDNPMWDTHAQNADRLQDALCPMFDVAYSALIEDLDQRGLLDETLVVAVGEFGRTPKINQFGGRDHWGHVFSCALAGAGIAGGQVYGSSDKTGGYPASHRVEPQQLTATVFHLLGVPEGATFPDRTGRPLPVTHGDPLWTLLGSQPATLARSEPGGDERLVPPFDARQIVDTDFESGTSLVAHGTKTRMKSWQASPLAGEGTASLSVKIESDATYSRGGARHAAIQFTPRVPSGARAILSQEVRSPRAGRFRFSVHTAASGADNESLQAFLASHRCRLVIFGFLDLEKNHTQHREFASAEISPPWSPDDNLVYERFSVTANLRSQDAGAMETSRGVGVAVIVEPRPDARVNQLDQEIVIRIDDAELTFDPRPRDDSVKV